MRRYEKRGFSVFKMGCGGDDHSARLIAWTTYERAKTYFDRLTQPGGYRIARLEIIEERTIPAKAETNDR